jgi:hypothetical protein
MKMKFDGFEMSVFFQLYIVFSFFNSLILILLCLLGLKEVKSSIIFDWIAYYRCVQYRASSDGTRAARRRG